ncbi:hypothetical protein PMAYCL1PPCAC_27484, partial [Pristionchus mayeri]
SNFQNMQNLYSIESLHPKLPDTPTDTADSSRRKEENQKMRGQKRKRADREESSIAPRDESHANRLPGNESRPSGVISSPSLNSSITSAGADCDLPDRPSWATLPTISKPYVDRLCFHLCSDEDGEDLANLALVSTRYHAGVHAFMKKGGNQPGLNLVNFTKSRAGHIKVMIGLYDSYLPFYGLDALDNGRFKRKFFSSDEPELEVTEPSGPILDQVSGLLTTSIAEVMINAWRGPITIDHLTLADQALRNSSITCLSIFHVRLDDDTA